MCPSVSDGSPRGEEAVVRVEMSVSRLTLTHDRQSLTVAILADAIVFGNTANSVEEKTGGASKNCLAQRSLEH